MSKPGPGTPVVETRFFHLPDDTLPFKMRSGGLLPEVRLAYEIHGEISPERDNVTHGPKGGYRLARHPGEISLLDIVVAAEGPATFDHCVLRDGPGDWAETCPVHDVWARTQEALIRELVQLPLQKWLQSTPP